MNKLSCVRYGFLLFLLLLLFMQNTLPSFAQLQGSATVSLTVPLRGEDFSITIVRTQGTPQTQEDQTLTYEIHYHSLAGYSLPVKLSVTVADALVNGTPVRLTDFVSGSITDGYNATPPIIDLLNNTISWDIASLPPNTPEQVVSFSTRTNGRYLGTSPIPFTVTAHAMSNGEYVTPAVFTQYYAHTSSSPSESSSSPSQPSSPAPANPAASQPTSKPLSPLSSIEMQTISSTTASTLLTFTSPARITVRYGTSPLKMTNLLRTAENVSTYSLVFPDLLPATVYYFSITATTDTGVFTSDIYTFTTASKKATSRINSSSLIITADNLVLSSQLDQTGPSLPQAVITTNSPFDFRFLVSDSQKIRSIVGILRNTKVLGISSDFNEFSSRLTSVSSQLIELTKGVYTGRLKANLTPGVYTLFARISDEAGNITEEPLATLTIVSPLTIKEAGSKRPLENVRVLFSRKAARTNEYTLLSEQAIAVANPLFTTTEGTIPTNLPEGEYKIHVSAVGYNPVDTTFTLSPLRDTAYPTVYLTKQTGISLGNTLTYYSETVQDVLSSFQTYLLTLGISNRIFNLVSLVVLLFFVIVTTLSFCIRFHIPVSALPAYFFAHVHLHNEKTSLKTLSGTVFEDEGEGLPISHAIVYLLDRRRKRIILHTQTDKLGKFMLPLPPASGYLLLIKKRHYLPYEHVVTSFEPIQIAFKRDPESTHSIVRALAFFLKNLIGLCFELLLFLSFILELVFSMSFGMILVAPYLIVSSCNLFLWLLYVKNRRYMS